jgi:hypothetical protein
MRPYLIVALKRLAIFSGAGLIFVALIYAMSFVVAFNPVRRDAGMFVSAAFWSLWGLVEALRYLISVRRALRLRAGGGGLPQHASSRSEPGPGMKR